MIRSWYRKSDKIQVTGLFILHYILSSRFLGLITSSGQTFKLIKQTVILLPSRVISVLGIRSITNISLMDEIPTKVIST